jgi:hypothetical protein
MSPSAPQSALRQILETRISQLSVEMEGLFAEARERGRRELADQLNQAVRRLRQSTDIQELQGTLIDSAAVFCTGAALFCIEDGVAKGEGIRGVSPESQATFAGLEIPLAAAAALAGAVESRDPVIAVSTPGEVSTAMMKLAGHRSDGRVSIFPIVLRELVPALVYAWGEVQGSALELLSQVAAASWSELTPVMAEPEPVPAPMPVPELVQIAPVAAPTPAAPAAEAVKAESAWERLTPKDQQIHFRAQRFARVQAAELRLHQADSVQAARTQRRVYDVLQTQIDGARESFRRSFFEPCASMVDYLHLELVRTLANDDPELLGKNYPGPMV